MTHHAQPERHPLLPPTKASRNGSVALRGRRMGCRRSRRRPSTCGRSSACPAAWTGHFHYADKKATRRRPGTRAKEPSDVLIGFDPTRVRRRGPLRRSRFDTAAKVGIGQRLPQRVQRRGAAGREVPLLAEFILPHLMKLKGRARVHPGGDVNIAHKEIDLKNWRSNQKNSGSARGTRVADESARRRRPVDVFRRAWTCGPRVHVVEQPRPCHDRATMPRARLISMSLGQSATGSRPARRSDDAIAHVPRLCQLPQRAEGRRAR